MNIGNNVKPRYICDKCGKEINYIFRKGYSGRNNYGIFKDYSYKKAFDLCNSCNRDLIKWLNEEPVPKRINITDKINEFEIFKGD